MQVASSPPIKNVIYPKVCNSEHFRHSALAYDARLFANVMAIQRFVTRVTDVVTRGEINIAA
jgi:hypothetical protein